MRFENLCIFFSQTYSELGFYIYFTLELCALFSSSHLFFCHFLLHFYSLFKHKYIYRRSLNTRGFYVEETDLLNINLMKENKLTSLNVSPRLTENWKCNRLIAQNIEGTVLRSLHSLVLYDSSCSTSN